MKFMAKEVIIIAGPNGSGKTTFARQYLQTNSYKPEFINADLIAEKLDSKDVQKVRVSAGKIFLKKIFQLISENKSFIIETTLSGKYLQNILNDLKKNDYRITLIFIFLESYEISIIRIKERVIKGGHFVPEEDIIRRFSRSIDNFWKIYKDKADYWYLIYNSENIFQEVAVGFPEKIQVFNKEMYQKFINILGKIS
jgi:predicted ABC-type ATPase